MLGLDRVILISVANSFVAISVDRLADISLADNLCHKQLTNFTKCYVKIYVTF